MSQFLKIFPLLFLIGCSSGSDPLGYGNEPLVLKIYDIPLGMGDGLTSMLNRNFRSVSTNEKTAIGRAEIMPNGQLSVLATPSVQRGVHDILESLKQAKVMPLKNSALETWVVISRSAEEAVIPANLAVLKESLQAASPSPTEFWLLEKMRGVSAEGTKTAVYGQFFSQEYLLKTRGEMLMVDFEMAGLGNSYRLNTEVLLERNQMLVLSESRYVLGKGRADGLGIEPGYYDLHLFIRVAAL